MDHPSVKHVANSSVTYAIEEAKLETATLAMTAISSAGTLPQCLQGILVRASALL